MGTTRIVLRTETKDKDGLSQIRLVYQISGKRQYFKTSLKAREENWDQKKQQAIYIDKKTAKKLLPGVDFDTLPSSKEIEEINQEINLLRKEVADIEKRFMLNKIPYSTQMVIDAMEEKRMPVTKKEATSKELYFFIGKYINDHSSTRKRGSLSVYKSLMNHLQQYQKQTGKNISFDTIDYSFFQEFQNFLIDKQGLNNTTVAKQLSTVKTFITYAKKQGVVISDKYKDFTIKKEKLEVIALTNDEFETLYKMDLSENKKLDHVRDVFCFSCVTGLRYSDLAQLNRVHIQRDEIKLNIQKTSEQLTIPLNPYSKAILAKYKNQHRPLPVISNAKMNEYLNGKDVKDDKGKTKHHKGLCEIAGINEAVEIVRFRGTKRETNTYPKYELITVHTGRKTFVTLSLEKGMSAEEVMSITGHKDYKSFSRYFVITDIRKKAVMSKAWVMNKKSNLKALVKTAR